MSSLAFGLPLLVHGRIYVDVRVLHYSFSGVAVVIHGEVKRIEKEFVKVDRVGGHSCESECQICGFAEHRFKDTDLKQRFISASWQRERQFEFELGRS